MGAPAARVSELARRWVQLGHQVTVLTSFPNHPTGVIPPEYRGKILERETWNGVDVVRVFIYAAPNKGTFLRSLSYFSFFLSSSLMGPFLTPRPDVVIATSPQFLTTLSGYVNSRLKRRPLIVEIRDLWPDSIVAVGAMKASHPVIGLLRRLERFIYRSSHRIVVVTRRFAQEIIARGIPEDRLKIVTNGVDLDMFRPLPHRPEVRRKLGVEGSFVSVYVGTIGMAHGIETILQVADKARSEYPDLLFLLVGEGARRKEVQAEAERMGLDNVRFLGQRPRSEMPEILGAADAALVPLRDNPLFRTVLPSKMFEAMGAGIPVILGVEGESKERLEEAGAGIAVKPESADALLDAVLRLRNDPELARELGRSARSAAEREYDRNRLAEEYAEWLDRVVPLR
jgi:glycosyltransferase involved in cell wall biosynthesis